MIRTSGRRSPTIIAIEDDVASRALFRRTIETIRPDIKVAAYGDGLDGIEAVEFFRPSVVLLDLNLGGGVDGREVITTLKANPVTADIPIVIVTGQPRAEVEAEMQMAGAYTVIEKPFDVTHLVTAVIDACGF